MTLKEAKMTIYENVVYACEEAGFSPPTIKMVKDACDTVIALAEQADTPQTDEFKNFDRESLILLIECQKERIGELLADKDTPQTDLSAEEFVEGMKNLKMEVKRTDCDRYVVDEAGEKHYGCMGCQTDCPWK